MTVGDAARTGFALVHGAGDVGWYWHLVEAELRSRGHFTVAPDLPADDESLTLSDYRDAVLLAVGAAEATEPVPAAWVVVGQSFGAFTAPLVAERLGAVAVVLVAGMVPRAGEGPDDWWEQVGYGPAAAEQSARDGGLTGHEDPYVSFYHDVPRALAVEAMSHERSHPSPVAGREPWPVTRWPPTVVSVVCAQDRFLPPGLQRRLARERLGVEPVEIDGGHCVALSRPRELADLLVAASHPGGVGPRPTGRSGSARAGRVRIRHD